jgi:hypothetical protein
MWRLEEVMIKPHVKSSIGINSFNLLQDLQESENLFRLDIISPDGYFVLAA